jgi:hypothetical protein
MTIRKDKKHKYGAAVKWVARPKFTEEEKAKAFYDLATEAATDSSKKPAASGKRLAASNTAPLYTDDSMVELTNSIIKRKARKAERTRKFADAVIADAKQKFERDHTGLPSILVADASNKPPTLEEYVKLGLQLSQLSQAERESIQFMLNKLKDREEDK